MNETVYKIRIVKQFFQYGIFSFGRSMLKMMIKIETDRLAERCVAYFPYSWRGDTVRLGRGWWTPRTPRPAMQLGSDHVHICMCWADKRVKLPAVRTQLTGAVNRLIVKFVIIFYSFSAFNLCIEYSVRYLTSGVKLFIQLQHRIKMSSNCIW